MAKTYLHDGQCIRWEHNGKLYLAEIQYSDLCTDPRTEDGNDCTMACWHGRYSLGDGEATKGLEPSEWWQKLVRELVPAEEVFQAAVSGKLEGIRLSESEDEPGSYDIYETCYLAGFQTSEEAQEYLEYSGIAEGNVADWINDDLTISHCQTLLTPYLAWLPLWLYDHSGITMSCGSRTYPYNDRWDSGAVGWIIISKETAMKLTIGTSPETCTPTTEDNWQQVAEQVMHDEVTLYDLYLRNEVYGYTLYEADPAEDPDWEEVDSCWDFIGEDVVSSGMIEYLPGLREAIDEDRAEEGETTCTQVVHKDYVF